MGFREFLLESERGVLGESIMSSFRKGLLAGAVALSPLVAADGAKGEMPPMRAPDFSGPRYKKMERIMKDEGRYYDRSTEKELRRRAEAGDEWAIRELPWPKDHRFHKMGRPFFRNEGDQPQDKPPGG